jgi:hypothetical protein
VVAATINIWSGVAHSVLKALTVSQELAVEWHDAIYGPQTVLHA